MKRLAVALALVAPRVAWAQIPVAPAPAAATPTPPPTGAGTPAPAPPPPPAESPAAEKGSPPADKKAPPGDEYFVEEPGTTPPPAAAEPAEPPPFEPPPPYGVSFEPPPPPEIPHVAPQSSLLLGARLGWFFPFGNLYAHANRVNTSAGTGYVLQGVPWRDYASSGPMFELNAGARLSRAYTLFALWERAQLGSGRNDSGPDGAQTRAESDFWAIGLRATSDADRIGFITEVAVGYRRARTIFDNDVEYQFTDAPFEARLGLGAELRLNRLTSLSSLISVGVGGFGSIERVAPNGNSVSLTNSIDQGDGHAWATLTIGAHFDLLPSKK